jgi:endonuclease G
MKKVFIAALMLFTSVAFAQLTCPQFFADNAMPQIASSYAANAPTLLCKKRYAIMYSAAQKTPVYVAEKITQANIVNANVMRKDDFRPDATIPVTQQASIKAFVGTHFDKGHMAPFEDFADDVIAADESFFMTNMVPQVDVMNRGIWRALEGRVRKVAERADIFVLTGPIYVAPIQKLSDGTPIPTSIFKVVLVPSTHEAFFFVLPNAANLVTAQLNKYMVTKPVFLKQSGLISVTLPSAVYTDKLELK